MDTVLLATDGSEYARRAAERAIEVAGDDGASLHVLCVVDRRVHGEPGLSSAELSTIEAEEVGHDCVAEVRSMVADWDVDVDVEGEVRHGIPKDVILEYAGEVGADCIVVGEHGNHSEHLGGVGRSLEDGPFDVDVVDLDG